MPVQSMRSCAFVISLLQRQLRALSYHCQHWAALRALYNCVCKARACAVNLLCMNSIPQTYRCRYTTSDSAVPQSCHLHPCLRPCLPCLRPCLPRSHLPSRPYHYGCIAHKLRQSTGHRCVMTQDILQQQEWGAIALKQDCHKGGCHEIKHLRWWLRSRGCMSQDLSSRKDCEGKHCASQQFLL